MTSSGTYATVKRALEAPGTAYAGKAFEVFLQGSYCNDTNVYAESDVDVVIRLDETYFHDISALSAVQASAFNAAFVPATYSYSDFKNDVIAALRKSFGNESPLAPRPSKSPLLVHAGAPTSLWPHSFNVTILAPYSPALI